MVVVVISCVEDVCDIDVQRRRINARHERRAENAALGDIRDELSKYIT